MRYSDILQFEALTDLIQLDKLGVDSYREDIVRNFVYPQYFIETIIPAIIKNLSFEESDRKGVQIIGNYGTGKSHLMSLVSLIAEDAKYLEKVTNETAKSTMQPIAGKYLVLRFEMQTDKNLWDIITYQLGRYMQSIGVDFTFDPESRDMYGDQLDQMMAAFESKYPQKGFLLVVDEMLSYLQNRAAQGQLPHDLQVLQALGQQCAKCRFGFMFGVQEMIYQARDFAFAAEMMLKVKDRYVDLTIRKEEVSYIVQNRLLRKSDSQKRVIREHLTQFVGFFGDMHDRLQEYVDLYPVHPSYFENFQKIRLGRSHREILKTLSAHFEKIKDNDVPTDNPGLITYDSYLEKLLEDTGLLSIPDFKTVSDTIKIIHDKIDVNFDERRKSQRPLAKRIANAAAIKLLQSDINKHNGVRAENLVDDLCITSAMADDRDFLVDSVTACAKLIMQATSGQYFDFNSENEEYYLRTEGGVNFDQQINQYAEQMSDARKDEAFFRFMVEVLGIEADPYRTGFQIYQHELEWRSHKVTRDGYIFFGNPNDKSTTQPRQYFYMIFMPIFDAGKKQRNMEDDEIYFVLDDLSEEFKELVCKYGAALSLWNSADTQQKTFYRGKYEDLFTKARREFDQCYLRATKVFFKDADGRMLSSYQLPAQSATKMEIFNCAASAVFEEQFMQQLPKYPAFTYAQSMITSENISRYIKAAFAKIANPAVANRDGEAILAGLGCYNAGILSVDDSIYAQGILRLMNEREQNMVVNKDEILEYLPNSTNIWRSKDYQIDAAFEFIVLAAMTALGECVIQLNGGTQLDATNLQELTRLQSDDYFTFAYIKRPQDVNVQVFKALTRALCGQDLSNRLDQEATYTSLVNKAKEIAQQCATFLARDLQVVNVAGVDIISEDNRLEYNHKFTALKGFCDQLQRYTSEARLRQFRFTMDQVQKQLDSLKLFKEVRDKLKLVKDLRYSVDYLSQAVQYTTEGTSTYEMLIATTGKFAAVLADPTDIQIQNYENELRETKAKYIEYYLERYYKYCITDIDNAEKHRILNSDEYKVCQVLKDCLLLNNSVWTTWRSMLFELKSADPHIESMLQQSPYASNFNPRQNLDRNVRSIRELGDELKTIYGMWTTDIQEYIKSDGSQAALRLMDIQSQDFANSIANGLRPIDTENIAKCVLELLDKLSDGLERVDISVNQIADYFTSPMSIGDAKGRFDMFIERMCAGKDRTKVRIVISKNNN